MKSKGIFSSEFAESIRLIIGMPEEDAYKKMDELLEMIDFSLQSETDYNYDSSLFLDNELNEWLYKMEKYSVLNDKKKEFRLKLEKNAIYQDTNEEENKKNRDNPEIFFPGLKNIYEKLIWNKTDFLVFKQNRLEYISDSDIFADELNECFDNIYFESGVKASLKTLNIPFYKRKKEIIEHLVALESFYSRFQKLLKESNGYPQLAEEFVKETLI